MDDKNLTIIEEIAPIEDIADEDIPVEDFAEDNVMIVEIGGVELNSLDFVPESGKLVYSENQAIFNGEFRYTTKRKPQQELIAAGSISFNIKGADGIVVDTDEDGTSVTVHIDGEILEKINGIDTIKLDITKLNGLVNDLRKEILKIDGIVAENNAEIQENTKEIEALREDLLTTTENLQTSISDIMDTALTTDAPQIVKRDATKIFENGSLALSTEDGADVVQINNYGTAISFLGTDGNMFYLNKLDKTASAFNKRLAFYDDIVEQHGTKVLVDGKFQETFNADLKADKVDIQNFVDMKKVADTDTGTIMNTGRTVSMGVQNQDSGSILGLSSNSLQLSISENEDESSMMMMPDHIDIDTKDLTWNGDTIATKLVKDLKNYYLKTETYTKDEVNQLIGTGSSLHFEVVTSLPTEDISTTTIYLIAKPTQTEDNIYDEYIYVSGKWELIGSTAIDLTDYYTKTEVDNKIDAIKTTIDGYGEEISTLQTNVNTNAADIKNKADKTNLDNKVDKTDFDELQTTVDNHETEIASLQADVVSNTNEIANKANSSDLTNYIPKANSSLPAATFEEDYVLVSDEDGNIKKRAMNKMLDDIGGSTILVDGIRQDTFEMTTKQDKLTAGENITIENNVISATGGAGITVDKALSLTSENPVQNKVITDELLTKADGDTVVHLSGDEEIQGQKTFLWDIKFKDSWGALITYQYPNYETVDIIGAGPNSSNENIQIEIGDKTADLTLIGKKERPNYLRQISGEAGLSTNPLALLKDIPDTSEFAKISDVDEEINSLTNDITSLNNTKADKSDITALEKEKANKTDVETLQSTKADKTELPIGLPIGSIIMGAIPLNDASVHLLDGGTISQNGIYADFATMLKQLVAQGKIGTVDNATFDSIAASTGNCGYFVIDDTTGTIRLPKITRFVQGLSNIGNIGHSLNAGLPNITGWLEAWPSSQNGVGKVGGAFVSSEPSTSTYTYTGTNSNTRTITKYNLSAQGSNSIYGNSETVQPQATQYPYYIVLANSIKSQVVVDINQIISELNNKISANGNQDISVGDILSNGLSPLIINAQSIGADAGWIQFTNGLQLCYGKTTAGSSTNTHTITFLKPFLTSSKPVVIPVVQANVTSGVGAYGVSLGSPTIITNTSATFVTSANTAYGCNYIAIGKGI